MRVKNRLALVGLALNLCLTGGLGGCSILDSSTVTTEPAATRQIPMLDTADDLLIQPSQPVLEIAQP